MLSFVITKRTDYNLLKLMDIHYSKPKGFVGRNICYAIYYNNIYYGHIVFGSATLNLPNRNSYFKIDKSKLNLIANNIFYHVFKVKNRYPKRNFTSFVLLEALKEIKKDWLNKYNDDLIGIESLVELPRTGELYKKANFDLVGETKGFTCKRISGISTDKWSGRRVWDYKNLRPKLVFCKLY